VTDSGFHGDRSIIGLANWRAVSQSADVTTDRSIDHGIQFGCDVFWERRRGQQPILKGPNSMRWAIRRRDHGPSPLNSLPQFVLGKFWIWPNRKICSSLPLPHFDLSVLCVLLCGCALFSTGVIWSSNFINHLKFIKMIILFSKK
jgi:hypothetical protein